MVHNAISWSRRQSNRTKRWVVVLLLVSVGTGACTGTTPPTASPSLPPTVVATATTAAATSAATELAPAVTPAAATETAPPMRLYFPALDLTVAVAPMAWAVTDVDGERQAVWEVPQLSAGWHVNSATVGANGNMIISGHHLEGGAVFAPLARGEVVVGDEILVTDDQGRIYRYQVSEVSAPVPATGATADDVTRAEQYLAPTTTAQLTLVTGWPDFSDTHYLFVVAPLVGLVQP